MWGSASTSYRILPSNVVMVVYCMFSQCGHTGVTVCQCPSVFFNPDQWVNASLAGQTLGSRGQTLPRRKGVRYNSMSGSGPDPSFRVGSGHARLGQTRQNRLEVRLDCCCHCYQSRNYPTTVEELVVLKVTVGCEISIQKAPFQKYYAAKGCQCQSEKISFQRAFSLERHLN